MWIVVFGVFVALVAVVRRTPRYAVAMGYARLALRRAFRRRAPVPVRRASPPTTDDEESDDDVSDEEDLPPDACSSKED